MTSFDNFVNAQDNLSSIIDILPDKCLSEDSGNIKRAYLMIQPATDVKLPKLDLTINCEKKVK